MSELTFSNFQSYLFRNFSNGLINLLFYAIAGCNLMSRIRNNMVVFICFVSDSKRMNS